MNASFIVSASPMIGIVAFLSIGLALLGVWLFGHPMGFQAILGTMGLVGLAINGGIVVLSALRANLWTCRGDLIETREVVARSLAAAAANAELPDFKTGVLQT